nr:MAG TPA: ATP synthase [Bacteriophage sp.]DAR91945.1 MAG TPA: ATP synthase [Bacteriophage sp.]
MEHLSGNKNVSLYKRHFFTDHPLSAQIACGIYPSYTHYRYS